MTPARPLTGPDVKALVGDVAKRLRPEGPVHVLVIVGGSLLAWRGLRDSTTDVDNLRPLNGELRNAIADVAVEHRLPSNWLNANAAMFIPATFDQSQCEQLASYPQLLVLGAPMRQVFSMKMYRALPGDVADMIAIWPYTGFSTAKEAVDAFYAAYPHHPDDEHLGNFVKEIAQRAGVAITD